MAKEDQPKPKARGKYSTHNKPKRKQRLTEATPKVKPSLPAPAPYANLIADLCDLEEQTDEGAELSCELLDSANEAQRKKTGSGYPVVKLVVPRDEEPKDEDEEAEEEVTQRFILDNIPAEAGARAAAAGPNGRTLLGHRAVKVKSDD